jgi:hypothetical protein
MKRTSLLTLVVCLLAGNALAAIDGAWTSSLDERNNARIYMNLTVGRHSNMGTTMQVADFTGLTAAQIAASAMTPVRFELRREAGTVSFEGTYRNGKGAGQFTFAPRPEWLAEVRAMGVDTRLDRDDTEEEHLFAMALHGVTTAFIKSMRAEGYDVGLEKYLEMRIFDITADYIREMRSLGFNKLDADDLVATKIHGVTPGYVREMRAAGWNLSLDELQASRIHGATPQFAADMKKEGYDLEFDDLVSFRIHGVTRAFIRELRQLGYDDVDAEDLVAMRIHGVTAEFIREIEAAGYKKVPVEKLVEMKIHNITPEYLRRMRGNG